MIKIYHSENNKLNEIDELVPGAWISVSNPSKEEQEELIEKYKVNPDFLEDSLDKEEIPRIDQEDGQLLLIISMPVKSNNNHEFYTTLPLSIILFDNFIMTISLAEDSVLDEFKHNRVRGFRTQYKTRFILQVLSKTTDLYLRYLKVLELLITKVEKSSKSKVKNNALNKMLKIEHTFVYFSTALRSNERVLERLLRHERIKQYPEDAELLDDVIIDNKQAVDTVDVYTNILSSTMEAYASIISNNQNEIMKNLTSITIIMSIPNIIAGLYGMNVALPFQNDAFAFVNIIAIIVVIAIIIGLILRSNDML